MSQTRPRYSKSAAPLCSPLVDSIVSLQNCTAVRQAHLANLLGDSTCLLIRLHSSIQILNLRPNPAYHPSSSLPCVNTTSAGILSTEAIEGRRIVDCAMDPVNWAHCALVDEAGGVWSWYEEKVEKQERIEKVMRL